MESLLQSWLFSKLKSTLLLECTIPGLSVGICAFLRASGALWVRTPLPSAVPTAKRLRKHNVQGRILIGSVPFKWFPRYHAESKDILASWRVLIADALTISGSLSL
jgi:hypothetical protein